MASNCRITRTSEGEIETVKTPEGKVSKLFNNLKKLTGNSESALQLYALSETEDFKEIQDIKNRKNDAPLTQSFFSDVVMGKSDKYKTQSNWKPILPFTQEELKVKSVYDKYEGNFDTHIATSIPTFRETQIKVITAIEKTLDNKPTVVNKSLESLKLNYIANNNLNTPAPAYIKLDDIVFTEIAEYHSKVKDDRQNPEMKKSYKAFLDETKKQYDYLVSQGYKIEPWLKEGEPYGVDSNLVRKDIQENKHLYYLRSRSATGENSENESAENYMPFEETGIVLNGDNVLFNDLFRAVHDIFGHGVIKNTFSAQGELNAYKTHSEMYSEEAQKALFLETVVYNAYYKNYNKYGPRKIYNIPQRFLDEINKKPLVYDIGGSEGGFVKTISEISNGSVETINLEPNADMKSVYDKTPVKGSTFIREAFNEGFEDNGVKYKRHTPKTKADIVHESMVFQFITPERASYIKEVKDNYLKSDGLLLLEEKFSLSNNEEYKNNEAKKALYKDSYYTKEQQQTKADNVLVGMGENQTNLEGFEKLLKQNFKSVEQYWDAGNFKGFAVSDSNEVVKSFMSNISSTESEFTTRSLINNTKVVQLKPTEQSLKDVTIENYKKFGILYHGTSNTNIKTTLSPPNVTGIIQEKGRKKNLNKVFFSLSEKSANIYAGRAYNSYGGTKRILEVVPIGEVEVLNSNKGTEVMMADSALVINKNADIIEQINNYFNTSNENLEVKDVIDFVNSSYNEKLVPQEVVELQNSLVGFNIKSAKELYSKLFSTLTNNKGVITFNKSKLQKSGLYNSYEIDRIISSPEIQKNIKEALLKLKNTEVEDLDYNETFSIPNSTKLSIFGKQISNNPYVLEKEIAESVAGVREEDILEALDPNVSDKYNTDAEFKSLVNSMSTSLRNLPILTVEGGELVEKKNNIKDYIQDIVISSENNRLSSEIVFLNSIRPSNWNQNIESVQNIVENVVELSKNNGLDLQDLSAKVKDMPREEVLNFLGVIENLLQNTNEETANTFSEAYNSIFEESQTLTKVIESSNNFDQTVESGSTEYELFRDFGLVKRNETTYRKTNNQSLEELYNTYFQNKNLFPSEIESVEDLVEHVQKETSKLNIPDYQVDSDVLEKMYMYKTYFGFPLNTQPKPISTQELNNVTYDTSFAKDFLKDFNKFIVQTGNNYFSVSGKGIEITSNDPLTVSEALLTVPKDLKEPLAQYNAISKNLNIELPLEETLQNIDANRENREYFTNNPEQAPKVVGDYTFIGEGVLAVRNEANNFVRTPTGVYEMVYEDGNVKFYGELPKKDKNYKLFDIEKPLSDMDFSEHLNLESSPEIFKTAKRYYSQKELEQINQYYFTCSI